MTLPADTPVTIPAELTVAMAVLLLLQLPPGVPLLPNEINDPAHTDDGPVIAVPAVTAGFIVTIVCVNGLPQPLTV